MILVLLLESHEGVLGRRLGFWVCCAKGALFLALRAAAPVAAAAVAAATAAASRGAGIGPAAAAAAAPRATAAQPLRPRPLPLRPQPPPPRPPHGQCRMPRRFRGGSGVLALFCEPESPESSPKIFLTHSGDGEDSGDSGIISIFFLLESPESSRRTQLQNVCILHCARPQPPPSEERKVFGGGFFRRFRRFLPKK